MTSLIGMVIIGAVLLLFGMAAIALIGFGLATAKPKPAPKPLDELLSRETHEIALDSALNEHVNVVSRIQKRRENSP